MEAPERDAWGRSFFFFQAEDGIRDIGVTGVQTCALPILAHRAEAEIEAYLGRVRLEARTPKTVTDKSELRAILQATRAQGYAIVNEELEFRSEERRVGKSVDLGGRRIIKKNNYTPLL